MASFQTHLSRSHLERLFVIEKGNLMFLLVSSGFSNHDFMLGPFKLSFWLLLLL